MTEVAAEALDFGRAIEEGAEEEEVGLSRLASVRSRWRRFGARAGLWCTEGMVIVAGAESSNSAIREGRESAWASGQLLWNWSSRDEVRLELRRAGTRQFRCNDGTWRSTRLSNKAENGEQVCMIRTAQL